MKILLTMCPEIVDHYNSALYLFNTGLSEIYSQARVVTAKYAAIIAAEFVHAQRSYGIAPW